MLPPGWFPFSSPTHITSVERMHRSSCRVITGCLSSTPIPLFYIEALLPPLRVTLTHQSLFFFERALRLPPTFPIASLANSNPRTRLKKSSWRSFSRSHNLTPNLHLTREPLILCPPKPPWSAPSNYTISLHLSSPCSCKDPPSLRNTAATSHLSTLSHSDISAWTDGSVPGGLGQGGAGIHIKCTKCVTATSLISTGLLEPRLLLAATVVLNHRISHISCSTALTGLSASGHFRPHPFSSGPLVPSMGSRPTIGIPRN